MSAQAPQVHPLTRQEWRGWLLENAERSRGVWLVTYKAGTGQPRMEYEASVEEALCFGWVDGKAARLDAQRSMLWFSPRKPGSGWAATNKARVERLEAAGLMMPAGAAKVAQARADGSWTRLDDVEALLTPPDLAAALAAHPPAAAHFDAFPRSVKRNILEWITLAKRAQTRHQRVMQTAEMAARNERANQWRDTPAGRVKSG